MCGVLRRADVISISVRMSILEMAQPFTESLTKAGLTMSHRNAPFAVLEP
jgi:hypothetical protein